MQLSLLCGLALLSWITWTACWMMWVNNCLPIMMYCLQHLLNLRKVSYLQQWLPHQWHYLAILLDMEAPPEPRDCAEHRHQPFHRVEQWNGTFFEESSLQLAGLVLHVGHGGQHCPASGCSNDEVTTEEEDDWEDVDQDGCPPNLQALRNQSCLIVMHTNGIHYCNVQYYRCPGAEDSHIQLMQAGMFPATTKATRTAFTFQVLDDFVQDNVECGTSAMNFYSKLHHITSNAFPHLMPDRYRELLRVARMWRLLKLLKWQGSHMSTEDAGPGELVLFCLACPQPGINIPEDATDYSHWTLAQSLVMDGNFKAEHMHPKDTGSKAWLMDGKGYMVASQPYKEYLSHTKNVVEILDCSNHWAVNQANANWQQLASMGIGGYACVWHGCFVLHEMVDFQKGEQQVNMDYALVHAVRHGTVPGQQVIHFYDINCQYSKECFARYAPNFIVGAGQVDGEIMETLWSSLNIISPSARGMATPHQQEATAMRLKWKLKVAEESYLVVEGRFADLNGNVPPAISQSWGEEVAALDNWLSRPQAMDIYEVRLQKGFGLSGIEAPSAKAIEIDLLAIPQPGHSQGMVTWIAKALKIEEAQIQLAVACWHISSRATEAQNLTIAHCHDHLQSHIHGIFDTAEKLFGDRFEDSELFHNYHMATHAWGRVANAEAAMQHHAAVYHQCHIQMSRLGAGLDILEQYKELNDSNLTISMAVSDPNARGHRDNTLPWIWTMDVPRDMATNDWISEFYRVNWLWMRALWDRWKEEVQLLKCKQEWTKNFFENKRPLAICNDIILEISQMMPGFSIYDISSFMLYLGMRFHCLVATMKKLDWSEYWHTSWYQHFLAEAGTMEHLMGMASCHPITLIEPLTANRLLTYLNDGDQSPCDILAFIKSLNPHLTRIKECHVKLATTMAHAWWQNDSGEVELGYERRLLQDVIAEAAEFFTGVSVVWVESVSKLYFIRINASKCIGAFP
ncbi:hypothetical protein F5J12DRAFT_785008 [Pisolithus orientalis]|uniref:uncharacterized protein n=1 Tax=Pisolithus orientalis TaxID=936130 RepID=UPI0022251627|nr:uncharacterized protein F5J12DRAFT_785008 [Pisolithus orientalis]KAI5997776.1 hypothetical protein F5J12DRAFT_785008 [Pisolithus orientalis]